MAMERQSGICPSCGEKGRAVSALTVTSQLTENAKARLGASAEGFSFCRTGDCEVGYFGFQTFPTRDVSALIFQKSNDPARLVCYCFNHSVGAIEEEIQKTENSTVLASIRESCKKGLDECEKNNPQGSCCLGNVAGVVKAAKAEVDVPGTDEDDCCCAATSEKGENPS